MSVTPDELWEKRAELFVAAMLNPAPPAEPVAEAAPAATLTDAERDALWENRGAVLFPHPSPVRTALAELARPTPRAKGAVTEVLSAQRGRAAFECATCRDATKTPRLDVNESICPACGL